MYYLLLSLVKRKKEFIILCSTVSYMQPLSEDKDKRNVHSKINLSQCPQLQLLITLCNVLHRVRSQDIRCTRVLTFFTLYFFVFVYGFFIC